MKCPIHLSDFNQIWHFLTDFHKVSNIKFHKNLSSRSKVDTCEWKDTDMKLKRASVTIQTCLTSDILVYSFVSILMVTEHRNIDST